MNYLKTFMNVVKEHSTIITTVGVCSGIVATAFAAIKETPKVNLIACNAEVEKGEPLTTKEKLLIYGKGYWKTIAIGVGTILLVCLSNYMKEKQIAALASTIITVEQNLKNFEEATEEVVGTKINEIKEKVVEKKIEKTPYAPERVYITGNGDTLFYDTWSGHYFKSDMETVRRAVNDMDRQIRREEYAAVDDFYWKLGLPLSISSNLLGWNNMMCNEFDLLYDSRLIDSDEPVEGTVCCTITFKTTPVFNYDIFD